MFASPQAVALAHRIATEPPFPLGTDYPLLTEAHQVLLAEAMENPPPVTVGEGRGIVMAVGGTMYFACAYVAVKVLRDLGCRLPIEWWHLGPSEMDPRMAAIAAGLGVQCVDALAVAARLGAARPRILNGWELKAFAAAHCGFCEVLSLDADNVVVADPTYLFDAPEYLARGAAFWPDLPPFDRREWMPEVVWKNVGLEYRDEPDFESGQFMVDKSRCARELGVAVAINSHSDWYYLFVFGDKSTFHLAWRVCGSDYAMTATPAGWIHPAIQQHDFQGHVIFQHVCQGKGNLANGNRLNGLVRRDLAVEAATALKRMWAGQIWRWEDQTPEEMALASRLAGRWFYHRLDVGESGRDLELKPGGEIGDGKAGCEQRWTARVIDGVPTVVVVGAAHKGTLIGMMFLREGAGSVWRGRWEAHERCPVELIRVTGETLTWAQESQDRIERESRENVAKDMVEPGVVECRALGRYKMLCRLDDITFTPHMLVHGYWESWVTLAVARLIRPGMRVVNVGANAGYYTTLFAAGVGPTGRVLAVEPQAELAELLARSAVLNGFAWVDVAACAAVDRDGCVDLTIPSGKRCNATVVTSVGGSPRVVPGRRLDDMIADWPRCDIVFIDAEGAEALVWSGMTATAARHRPTVIMEFNAGRYADAQAFLADLAAGRELRTIRLNGDITPIGVDDVLAPGSEHMLVI